jgi:hypothetical protein
MPLYNKAAKPRTQFSLLHRSLLSSEELPFRSLVTDQRVAEIFAEEGVDFGQTEDAVYTPAITLWGLLSQVFFKEEQRSCLAAVVRIAALWLALGQKIDSTNTGACLLPRAEEDPSQRTPTDQSRTRLASRRTPRPNTHGRRHRSRFELHGWSFDHGRWLHRDGGGHRVESGGVSAEPDLVTSSQISPPRLRGF